MGGDEDGGAAAAGVSKAARSTHRALPGGALPGQEPDPNAAHHAP